MTDSAFIAYVSDALDRLAGRTDTEIAETFDSTAAEAADLLRHAPLRAAAARFSRWDMTEAEFDAIVAGLLDRKDAS